MASVLVFCVPRALMSICLDPTHLVTCLLIFPSCFPSLPSSFAPFIISLCLQFRVGSLSNVRCRPCPDLSCPVQPCPALSSLVLPCPALSSPALPASQPVCFSPTGLFLFVLFVTINKAYFPPAIGSSQSPSPSIPDIYRLLTKHFIQIST